MGFIARLFSEHKPAERLYTAIVNAARAPELYGPPYNVPDTVEGRFEMLTLHLYALLRVLKPETDTAQRVFNLFCADLDANARELGVGDLSVGKKVKDLVAVFYGRVLQYDEARGDAPSLVSALQKAIPSLSDNAAGGIAAALPGYETRLQQVVKAKGLVPLETLLQTPAALSA